MNTMLSEQLVVTASARAKIVDLLEEAGRGLLKELEQVARQPGRKRR